eukprot:gene11750-13203_t
MASHNSGIFIPSSTWSCLMNGCVACLYKAFPFGTDSMEESSRRALLGHTYPKNTRPESCLRVRESSKNGVPLSYQGLQSLKKTILVVGDGDFSFSLALAESNPKRAAKNLVVSSYESEAKLKDIYPRSHAHVEKLKKMGVEVLFQVDGTALSSCPALSQRLFDLIAWNFPCVCGSDGADGQVHDLEANLLLMKRFFESSTGILKPLGQLHITHKTVEPFSWWDLPAIGEQGGFSLLARVVFDKYNYPGYSNRKALDAKSFPCHDARTFVFRRKEECAENNLGSNDWKKRLCDIQLLDEKVVVNYLTSKKQGGVGGGAYAIEEKRLNAKRSWVEPEEVCDLDKQQG